VTRYVETRKASGRSERVVFALSGRDLSLPFAGNFAGIKTPTGDFGGMNLTTQPITIAEHNLPRPEFIRLPKPGASDPWTGLGRSSLNTLVSPCRENGYKPPVRSCTLRRRGTMRGVRLVDLQSLLAYIDSLVEPAYPWNKAPEQTAAQIPQNTTVQKLALNQSLRVIMSIRVEEEKSIAAEGANVSP
jgi:hypothetical protein